MRSAETLRDLERVASEWELENKKEVEEEIKQLNN